MDRSAETCYGYKAAGSGKREQNSKINAVSMSMSMDGLKDDSDSDSVHLFVPRCPQSNLLQDVLENRKNSLMEFQFQLEQLERSCQEVCSGIDVNTLHLVDLLHRKIATNALGDRTTLDLPISQDTLLRDSKQYFLHDQKCIYSIRELWTWIHKITHCIQTHITNASEYHQFFHDAKVCEDGLQTLVLVLQRSVEKSVTRAKPLAQLQKVIKEVTGTLLSIEELIENLLIRSQHISPIRERVSLSGARKGRVLLEYTGDGDVAVKFNDEVTVLEVCTDSRWKVREARNRETSVPGFIVQLKGVDNQVLAGAKLLQDLLETNWLETARLLREEFHRSLLQMLRQFASQIALMHFSESDRLKNVKILEELREFHAASNSAELINTLDAVADSLRLRQVDARDQPRIDASQFVESCKLMRTCLNLLKDLEFYQKHFCQLLKRQRTKTNVVSSSSLFIAKDDRHDGSGSGSGNAGGSGGAGGGDTAAGGSEKYVSRAYITKVPPGRKADPGPDDTVDGEFRSELRTPLSNIIFIEERHSPYQSCTPAPDQSRVDSLVQTLNSSNVHASLATLVTLNGVGYTILDAIQSGTLNLAELSLRLDDCTVDLGSNNAQLHTLFDEQHQLLQTVFRIMDEFSIAKWITRHRIQELMTLEDRGHFPAELCYLVNDSNDRVESLAKANKGLCEIDTLNRQPPVGIFMRQCEIARCTPLIRDNTLIEFPGDQKVVTQLLNAALDSGLVTRQSLVQVDLFDATVSPQCKLVYVDNDAMHVLRLIMAARSALETIEDSEGKYLALMQVQTTDGEVDAAALVALADEIDTCSATLIHAIDAAEKDITKMNRENRIDDRVNDIYKTQYPLLEKDTRNFKMKYKKLIGEIRTQIDNLRKGSPDDEAGSCIAKAEAELSSLRILLQRRVAEFEEKPLPWSKSPLSDDDVRNLVESLQQLEVEAASLKESTDESSFEKWTQVDALQSNALSLFSRNDAAPLSSLFDKSSLILDTLNSASSSLELRPLVADAQAAVASIKEEAKLCKLQSPSDAHSTPDASLADHVRQLFNRAIAFNVKYLEDEVRKAEQCAALHDHCNSLIKEANAALRENPARLPLTIAKTDALVNTLKQIQIQNQNQKQIQNQNEIQTQNQIQNKNAIDNQNQIQIQNQSNNNAIENQNQNQNRIQNEIENQNQNRMQRLLACTAEQLAANLRSTQTIVAELESTIADLDCLCKTAQKEANQSVSNSTESCIKTLDAALMRKRAIDDRLHAAHRAAMKLKEVAKDVQGLDLSCVIANCEKRIVACNAISVKNALHHASCRALTRKVEQAFTSAEMPVESSLSSCVNDLLFSDVTQIIENFEKALPELTARLTTLNNSFNCMKPLLDRAEVARSEFSSRDLEANVTDLRNIMQRLQVEINNTEKEIGCIEVALPLLHEFKTKRWRLHGDLDMLEVEISGVRDEIQMPASEMDATDQLRANLKQVRSMQNLLLDLQPDLASLCALASDLSSLGVSQPSTEFAAFLQRFSNEDSFLKDKIRQLEENMARRCTEFSAQLENAIEQVEQLETLTVKTTTTVTSVSAEQPEKIRDQLTEAQGRLAQIEACMAKLQHLIHQFDSVGIIPDGTCTSESESEANPKEHLTTLVSKVMEMRKDTEKTIHKLEQARKLSEKVSNIEGEVQTVLNLVRKGTEAEERSLADTFLSEFEQKRVVLQSLLQDVERAKSAVSANFKPILQELQELDYCGVEAKVRSIIEKLESESEQLRELLAVVDEASTLSSAIRDRMGLLRTWLPERERILSTLATWSTGSPTVVAIGNQLAKLQSEKTNLLEKDADFAVLQNDFQQLVRTFDDRRAADVRTERSPSADSGYCPATLSGLVEIQTEFSSLKKKWEQLVSLVESLETSWQTDILKLGKLEESADLLLHTLTTIYNEVSSISTEKEDFQMLEKSLKQIESVQRRLSMLEPNMNRLFSAIEEGDTAKFGAIFAKQRTIKEQYTKAQEVTACKFSTLSDILFYFRRFLQKIDELLWYVTNFGKPAGWSGANTAAAESKVLGATPKVGKKLFERFLAAYEDFSKKSVEIESVLRDAPLFLSKCEREDDGVGRPHGKVIGKLRRLDERHALLKVKLQTRKQLFEVQLKEVVEFHAAMQEFQSWIALGESKLKDTYIYRLPQSSAQQLDEHRCLLDELVERSALMDRLSLRGTSLKYQGSFEEGIQIDNLVTECRLRFKKLKCRTEERGRILQQAAQETKRFHDWCATFTNWVDAHLQTLLSFVLSSSRLRQERDELKKINTELQGRTPAFTNISKQAKVYIDLANGFDSDYVGLQEVLNNIQRKHAQLKHMLKEQRIKIDQLLLASGDDLVALESLLEWCEQILPFLEEQKSQVLGELECVETLIDQQRSLKSDFDYFASTVHTLKTRTSEKMDSAFSRASKTLLDKWEQIEALMLQRDNQLQRSLSLAQEFKRLHDDLLAWIAAAENDLHNYWLSTSGMFDDATKYTTLTIGYSKFSEEMAREETSLEQLLKISAQILHSCHVASRKPVAEKVANVKSHFEQLRRKVFALSDKLKQAEYLKTNRAEHVKLLLDRLNKFESEFGELQRAIDSLWDDCATKLDFDAVGSLVTQNNELMIELSRKTREFDTLTALLRNDIRVKLSEKSDESVDAELPSITHVLADLQQTWNRIWSAAQQQRKQLEVLHRHHNEMEKQNKTFDFEAWRTRFLVHVSEKKQRVTDIFRRQDSRECGRITKAQFVQGVQLTGFKTTKAELTLVFDLIARGLPDVDYDRFFSGLRKLRGTSSLNASLNASVLSLPGTSSTSNTQSPHGFSPSAVSPNITVNQSTSSPRRAYDNDALHQEVLTEVKKCRCTKRFSVERVDAGQYRLGTEKKNILLRLSANNTVVVRIGGGWCSLRDYVAQHDPCRAGISLNLTAKSTPKGGLSKSKEILSAPGTPRNGTSQLQIECCTPRKTGDELLLRVANLNTPSGKHLRSRSAHATQLGE